MTQQKAQMGTLFLIVFIDLVGFGIVIPILPLYAEQYGPSPMTLGLLMASFSAMQFLFSPILGRLSDRIGRRPVLLVSLLGSAFGYFLFGFAGSLLMLFASRIIDGISGGNISTAQAVIADITTPQERAKGMGMIGAAFGLGFILGPAIGGLLVQVRPWLPGVAAGVTSLIAFVGVMVFLPETLTPTARRKALRHPLNMSSMVEALLHPSVGACIMMIFCIIFAFSNFETTFAQFVSSVMGFSTRNIYWLFVYAGVLGALVQGGLVRHLVPRFGEAKLVVVGTFLACIALVALPYTGSTASMLGVLALLALGQGVAQPSLSALTSKIVSADEVGGVMGVYQAMSSLARIAGPLWAEIAYGEIGVAWPYFSGAATMFLASLIALDSMIRLKNRPSWG